MEAYIFASFNDNNKLLLYNIMIIVWAYVLYIIYMFLIFNLVMDLLIDCYEI